MTLLFIFFFYDLYIRYIVVHFGTNADAGPEAVKTLHSNCTPAHILCFFHFFDQFPFASNWKHSNKQNRRDGRDCKIFIPRSLLTAWCQSARLPVPAHISLPFPSLLFFFVCIRDYWLNVIKANTGWRLFSSSDCVKLFRDEITSRRERRERRTNNTVIHSPLTITMGAMRNNASGRATTGMHVRMAWLEKWLEAISRVLTRRIVIDAVADSVQLVV